MISLSKRALAILLAAATVAVAMHIPRHPRSATPGEPPPVERQRPVKG